MGPLNGRLAGGARQPAVGLCYARTHAPRPARLLTLSLRPAQRVVGVPTLGPVACTGANVSGWSDTPDEASQRLQNGQGASTADPSASLERQQSGEAASTSGRITAAATSVTNFYSKLWKGLREELAAILAMLTAAIAWLPAVKQRVHLKRLKKELEQAPKAPERCVQPNRRA